MHIEFLVEDSSGKMLLELLIPQIIGPFYTHLSAILDHPLRISGAGGVL